MVKLRPVEVHQGEVTAIVFFVALHALPRGEGGVKAGPRADPGAEFVMTEQAFFICDVPAELMTRRTGSRPLEGSVSLAKLAR